MVIMAYLRPTSSAMPAMISGTKAPPTIPVQSIPENVPWWCGTEFIPRENTTDHMMDRKNPAAGNAIVEMVTLPNNASVSVTMADTAKTTNTDRLSNNFMRKRPKKHPSVIRPQKYDIAVAPSVAG